MPKGRLRLALAVLLFGLLACGGVDPHAHTSGSAHPKTALTDRQRAFDSLHERLAEVHDPGDPIDAMPASLQRTGRERIGKLSPENLRDLLRPDGQAAKDHPLLYLLAGGHDLSVLARVRQNSDGDLTALWRASGNSDFKGLIPIAHEVGRRATTHWVALTATRLQSADDVDVATCEVIERIGVTLGLTELARSAAEMAVVLEPSAMGWLAVANGASMGLDVPRARSAIERAKRSEWKKASPLPIADSEHRAQNAELALARTDANASSDALLKKARALSELGRDSDVIDLLAPRADRVRQHAGLAVSLAAATFSYLADRRCPVASGSELSQVCFVLLDEEPTMKRAIDWAHEAWKTGQGRDVVSAETYVGLIKLLPVARTFLSAQNQGQSTASRDMIDALTEAEASLGEAQLVAPDLEGVHLYAESMKRFVSRGGPYDLWPTPAERSAFQAEVRDIAQRRGGGRWGQTGVVVAASLLALDGNSTALVDALPRDIHPSLRLPRAWIRLWTAVVEGDTRAIGVAEAGMTEVMPSAEENPIAHEECSLVIAEVDAFSKGDAASYQHLDELAAKLTGPRWPVELRVRATIDQAGASSRAGRAPQAIELLRNIPPEDAASAGHWADVAKAYRLILEAESARGDERKRLVTELGQVAAADPIRSSNVWLDMWLRELTFLSTTEGCGPTSACVQKASKERKSPDSKVDAQLGHWLSALLRHGGLDIGALSSSLGYSTGNGILARTEFSFALPAVEFPKP